MAADHFFARWARPKLESVAPPIVATAAPSLAPAFDPIEAIVPSEPPLAPPLPSMDDVAKLTRESDYAPFIARGVDQAVQRGALKKLFADPHFNLMDGLDIYIGDYNTADPIPAAMLALLDHAKGVLDPLSMFEKPVMQLLPKLEPNLAPEPQTLAGIEPPLESLEPPLDPPLEPAEPASSAELESARDGAPTKTLPDTDEHTIQGL